MISRRGFLEAAARATGTAAVLPFAWASPGQLDRLARTAPRARYWTTAALSGADCGACHPTPPRGGQAVQTRSRADPLPAVCAALRHPARAGRPLPRAGERERRTAKPGLRAAAVRAHRPDREEAVLPLPSGRQRPVVRNRRVPAAMPLLPELGTLAVLACGPRSGLHAAGRSRGESRGAQDAGRSPSPTTSRPSSPSTCWTSRPPRGRAGSDR